MKLRKLSAIMMAAVVATSTPAGAVLGQITAYADSDKDKSKDYEIGGADWDVQEDANGKIHIYATWDASDDSCRATITVTRDDKKTGISVDTTTTKGSVELTQQSRSMARPVTTPLRSRRSQRVKMRMESRPVSSLSPSPIFTRSMKIR